MNLDNIKTNNENKGIVIAELLDKESKKSKAGDIFWRLKLSVDKKITKDYFELTNNKQSTVSSGKKPFYVFTNKNRFANTLVVGYFYLFEYEKSHNGYYHIEDWNKLDDDKRVLQRLFHLIKMRSEDEEEETNFLGNIDNKSLLTELKKRLDNGRIIVDSDKERINIPNTNDTIETSVITDLRDRESKYYIDLKKQ